MASTVSALAQDCAADSSLPRYSNRKVVIEITQYQGDGTRGGDEFVKSICLGLPRDLYCGYPLVTQVGPKHNSSYSTINGDGKYSQWERFVGIDDKALRNAGRP